MKIQMIVKQGAEELGLQLLNVKEPQGAVLRKVRLIVSTIS